MILPHTAVADAAEGKIMLGHVHGAVVDAHTAGHGIVNQPLRKGFVPGEEIQGQGPRPRIDVSASWGRASWGRR